MREVATDVPSAEEASPAHEAQASSGSRVHGEMAAGITACASWTATYPPGTLLPNEAEWGKIFGGQPDRRARGDQNAERQGLLVSRPKWARGSSARPLEPARPRCAGLALRRLDKEAFLRSLQEVRRIWSPALRPWQPKRPHRGATVRTGAGARWHARGDRRRVDGRARRPLSPHTLLAATNNELLAPFGIIIEQALANLFHTTRATMPSPSRSCRCTSTW